MSTATGNRLPTFDELPPYKNFKGCAWEVWGKDDQLGTVNLLTPEVVKEAALEIKYVHPGAGKQRIAYRGPRMSIPERGRRSV